MLDLELFVREPDDEPEHTVSASGFGFEIADDTTVSALAPWEDDD